ncbi:hypothetical protein C8R46DRAFT_864188, partial [Mycena filopes]
VGGDDWIQCVEKLLVVERAWGFRAKGLLGAPGADKEGRPKVVTWFMKYARKWDAPAGLLVSTIGPRTVAGSFASAWWNWWRMLQPEGREQAIDGTWAREELDPQEWECAAKMSGRNGLLLHVGCLLWWGEAVVEAGDGVLLEDWKEAVRDVAWVLSNV